MEKQALVLAGGGARAAYQVGCLRAIARRVPEYRPQILTGVSAGAINAAHLAARILGISDDRIAAKVKRFHETQTAGVLKNRDPR